MNRANYLQTFFNLQHFYTLPSVVVSMHDPSVILANWHLWRRTVKSDFKGLSFPASRLSRDMDRTVTSPELTHGRMEVS